MFSKSLTRLNILHIIYEKQFITRTHIHSYLKYLLYINYVGEQGILLSYVFYWQTAFL